MSNPDLVLRVLREFRAEMHVFRDEMHVFRDEMRAFQRHTEERLGAVEQTVNGIAGHLFGLTHFVKTIDRRVRKLETRATK